MTDPSGFGSGAALTFNAPLSAERADRLARLLADRKPAAVLDLGCGWGELLLRILAMAPDAVGIGIDSHRPDTVRGRANAEARGLAERVTFVEAPAADHRNPADLVLSVGAYQAYGSVADALAALLPIVNPGGRLLFAAEIWDVVPSAEQVAAMWPGMTVEACLTLPELVDATVGAGFRPLGVETSTRAEWDEFESGFARNAEEWLLVNSGHPEAEAVRAKLDQNRSRWLRGSREVMGFAFLTLGVTDDPTV